VNRLREAAAAFARTAAHPVLSVERLLATERAAAGLEARRMKRAARIDRPAPDTPAGRRSADRAIVEAYLLTYPVDRPGFAALQQRAASAADRHDWRWRAVGARLALWEGHGGLAEALASARDPAALLREAGFVGRLAEGAFVSAARADAVRSAR
jgi:hypothetical protein